MEKKNWKDLGFLFVGLSVLFFSFLGNRPLSTPDEGRYVEIPREMVESGDWVTPHLNGLKYFEKPPFVYWVEAISIKLFGIHEYFLRLPMALFALFGCFGVYLFCCKFYSRQAGIWGAIVLGTSTLYFVLGRIILLDMVLTTLLSCGLFAGFAFVKTQLSEGIKRRLLGYLSMLFIGLAVLTKGLVALALPALIVAVWLLMTREFQKLRPLYIPTRLLLLLVVILPWHILVSLKNPTFFDFYFIHEHFERYLTTIHRRFQPIWFFVPVLIAGFLPWTIFLPRALKDFFPVRFNQLKTYDIELFLSIWIVVTFLFFSFSSSKLIPYILPAFPPLAVIVGRYLSYVWKNHLSVKAEGIFYGLASLVLTIGIAYAYDNNHINETIFKETKIAQYILFITGALIVVWSFFNKTRILLTTLVMGQIIFLFALNQTAYVAQKPSIKPLVDALKERYGNNVEVISYGKYYQDLPPYLGRTIKISQWNGELDFGKKLEPDNNIFVNHEEVKGLWQQSYPVCLVTPKQRYEEIKHELLPVSQEIAEIDSVEPSEQVVLVCNR